MSAAQTVSETVSEKQRGRPRDPLLEHWRPTVIAFFPDLKTERGIADRCYAQQAFGALRREAPDWGWLLNCDGASAGTFLVPWSVLAELGRLRDPELICDVASQLLELDPKPTAREAVAMLRAHRQSETRA